MHIYDIYLDIIIITGLNSNILYTLYKIRKITRGLAG